MAGLPLAGPLSVVSDQLSVVSSGWAGAGESFGLWGWRRTCGKGGPAGDGTEVGAGSGIGGAVPASGQEGDQIAAVVDDVAVQLDPGPLIQLVGLDAEIEADIDEDGGDQAATVLGGDFLQRGRAGEEPIPSRVVQAGGPVAAVRLAWGRRAQVHRLLEVLAAGGSAAQPFLERGGAEQATRDTVEDQREIAGLEGSGDEGEAGEQLRRDCVELDGGGEIPAVGDEGVDEAEELTDAPRDGPVGLGVEGFDRCGGCVEHGWH